MRKLFLVISVLSTVLLSTSCKKKLTQFYIDYNSEIIIQSTIGQALPVNLYTPEIETNSEFEFQSNDTRKDKIRSIYLKDLVLTITSPQGETFSFLNSVELFISSPSQVERKVAFKENIPSNTGNELRCELVDLDLQDFIKDDSFTLRVKTVTDETLAQDVKINVYTNFLVDAKLVK